MFNYLNRIRGPLHARAADDRLEPEDSDLVLDALHFLDKLEGTLRGGQESYPTMGGYEWKRIHPRPDYMNALEKAEAIIGSDRATSLNEAGDFVVGLLMELGAEELALRFSRVWGYHGEE